MLIVDTSAVVEVLVSARPAAGLIERLSEDGDLHAPHLIDVEILSALRGLVRSGSLSADRATDARRDFSELAITRYPHEPLSDRAWELRDNASAYDAMFLALAELIEAPLITCDIKLGSVPGVAVDVELFASG